MATIFFERLNDSSLFLFLVPFLLVFAIVYGILSKIEIFENKRINIGISIIIGLIFASVSLASNCLGALIPKFVILITVLLIFYMVMGLMINLEDKKSLFNTVLGVLAALGFIIILFMSSEACGIKIGPLSWTIGDWWKWVAGIVIVGGLFIWMINGSRDSKTKKPSAPKLVKTEEKKEAIPEPQKQGPLMPKDA